jgi:YVTN family beta-propeller protein
MENLKTIFAVLILFTIILVLSAANAVHAIEVTATVPVGSAPTGVVYDSNKGEVFVANSGSNSVSVISDANNSVVATIPLQSGSLNPVDLTYDSGKGEIFVLNSPPDEISFSSSTITVIADSNNSIVATITLGFNSVVGISYDSAKGEIFVAGQNPGGPVTIISDTNNSVVSTVLVGGHPQGIVYDSGMGETFVSVEGDTSNWVSVISDNSNTVVAKVTVENVPIGLAYDPGKGEIFVSGILTPELSQVVNPHIAVSVISDQTDTVVASIPMPTNTVYLTYDSKQGEIFVNYAGDNNTLSVISDSNDMVIANVTIANSSISSLAYDSSKSEIFASNPFNDTVSVMSDYSAPPATPTPTQLPSSPTVPEFSSDSRILMAVAVVVVTSCAVASALRKSTRTMSDSRNNC